MATIHINKWSRHARLPRANALAQTKIQFGDARHIGYIDLAIFISWKPQTYSDETLGKAHRISAAAGLQGPARSCLTELVARENERRA